MSFLTNAHTWEWARKSLKCLGEKTGRLLCDVKNTISFRLILSFPPNWKLSLRCSNMFIAFHFFVPALLGIVFFFFCKVFVIFKVRSSTLLAERSFRHAFYLVRVVRVGDIRIAWLVYLACLRSHLLRDCCNFESKQAISITLFGRRPNTVFIRISAHPRISAHLE